jgi:RNA polymerase sigma-70 factor, ECF subfamily
MLDTHAFVVARRDEPPRAVSQAASTDDGASTFVNARSRMLAAALRTLGNAAEAEDIVQDVWLRWQCVDRDVIRNAPAFLTTATRRLAINRVRGARTRRETPLELRLVEPADASAGPGTLTERGQELESALLLLLARLAPKERAAYLLREAFNYSYQQVARVVGVTEANSRQLVTRARKHLADGPGVPVCETRLRRLANAFVDATRGGDLCNLEALLSADIVDSLVAKSALRTTVTASTQ